MILSLNIKNIALIEELSIELGKGLNILSGETGAGKSIIIDSLNFVLGDRADHSLIRHGEKIARVEVVFDDINPEVISTLEDLSIEIDDVIVITRVMSEGRSICRINSQIVNLSALRKVVGLLVDVHSQNEHQSLMKASTQLKILDDFSPHTQKIKEEYQLELQKYYEIQANLEQYSTLEDRERAIDLLSYQIEEITKAMPREGEEQELINSRSRYYNFQKINQALTYASDYLDSGMTLGALSLISKAIDELKSIETYDDSLISLIERLESVEIEVDDISQTLKEKLSSEGIDDINIDTIEKRLDEIRLIKKKYGKTIEEIENFLNEASERLDMLLNCEKNIEKLQKQLKESGLMLIQKAKALHKIRHESSNRFSNSIVKHLKDLGMTNTVFMIDLNFPEDDKDILNNLTINGVDKVEFLWSPNLGEPVKPLAKIASGGELSRFMLALKNVIADIDDIGTLVFDEIDSGISGKIAKEVAKKLCYIASARQVLAITHLPQLASMADCHYLIEKREEQGKTRTGVTLLNKQNSLKELMRLSGSKEDSQAGLNHAKELKEWADEYKKSLKK
ncbi:MAG: DNA repair protein RecN [Bacillota bacterium]|jgi:DNA repair protein RecN (Recombination protein N)|nr:DNA repair protein RecN [Bacillota bacterium]HHU42886.1 DNA repair protein RecN [Clostridiales bacterium]